MSTGSWDEAVAESLVGGALLGVILAGTLLATTLIILLTELGRVYLARAFRPGRAAAVLWASLAGFLGICLVAGVLVSGEGSRPQGLYLGAWSFLLFTVVVLGVDWLQSQGEPALPAEAPEVTVEDLLSGGWKDAA